MYITPHTYLNAFSHSFLPMQGEVWDSCNGSNFYLRISQLPPGVLRGPIPPLVPQLASSSSSSGGTGGHQTVDELAKRMTSKWELDQTHTEL